MLVKWCTSAHGDCEKRSLPQSPFSHRKYTHSIQSQSIHFFIAKAQIHSVNPFPQLNSNKSLIRDSAVISQQTGVAKHIVLRRSCVSVPSWVVKEGYCCSTQGSLPDFLYHTSHIYSPNLTYKCSCIIYFHALFSNSPDLN